MRPGAIPAKSYLQTSPPMRGNDGRCHHRFEVNVYTTLRYPTASGSETTKGAAVANSDTAKKDVAASSLIKQY